MSLGDRVVSTAFRVCLLGQDGRIAAVVRVWANTDEGAEAKARDMLRVVAPRMIGFELWNGSRKIAEGRKSAHAGRSQVT